MRLENSIRNSFYGLVFQLSVIITGFINRAFFLNYLGYEYLGYNGLFTNIIGILSVAELGIGTAVAINLYAPLKSGDTNKINSIMIYLKRMYRSIGFYLLVIGCIMMLFIQFFVKEDIDNIAFIRLVFFLYIINSVFSYFIAYKRTLLIADQKNYILSKADLLTKTMIAFLQIVTLVIFKDYIVYLLISIAFTLIENMCISKYVNEKYDYLNLSGDADSDTKQRIAKYIKSTSLYKILDVGIFSTDNLIISIFLGIISTGLYSNYSLIITSVQGIFKQIFNAVIPSIGELLVENDKTRINEIFSTYNFICFISASFTSISLGLILQPFIELWLGKPALIPLTVVMVLALNVYINFILTPLGNFVQASGLIKEILPVVFLEFIANIIISIFLVLRMGLVGIFIGTTVAYFIAFFGQAQVLHSHLIGSKLNRFYLSHLKYLILFIIEFILCYEIVNLYSGSSLILNLILPISVCIFIPNSINLIVFRKSEEFKYITRIIVKKSKIE